MKLYFSIKKLKVNSKIQPTKGFALLLAVVVSGIVLSITYLMFSINIKQIGLSTTGANSQYALFAADTGVECALFGANKIIVDKGNPFVDFVDNDPANIYLSPIPVFNCNGVPIVYSAGTNPQKFTNYAIKSGGTTYPEVVTSDFTVYSKNYNNNTPGLTDKSCAIVHVDEYLDPTAAGASAANPLLRTHISSRGYNTCYNLTDPQRVERGLEANY